MAEQQQLTPQQRGQLFTMQTRQFQQSQPSVSGGSGETLSFDIVKTRYTAKVQYLVEATVKVTHATKTAFKPAPFAPYTLFNSVRMDINNGFNPFIVNGRQWWMYNKMRENAEILDISTHSKAKVQMELKAAAAGATNKIQFVADMPLQINERDPIGLVMTQNQATTVTCNATIAMNGDGLIDKSDTGFTTEIVSVKITPVITSYSIPRDANAQPSLATVKLVQSTSNDFSGGQHDLKLTPGYTYRKIGLFISDENGVGLKDSQLAGKIEMILNQADFPISIPPQALSALNHEQYGQPLPEGIFILDFSWAGQANYAGTRDYVDTEAMTEFWIRFNASVKGRVEAVYETLSLMRG